MKEEKEKTIQDVISRRKQHTRRVDSKLIMKAYNYAYSYHGDQCRKSGEPYIIHPLNVAYILADIGLDDSTICAALLHDVVEDTEVTQEDITREFGKEISDMVAGVTKLSNIQFSSVEEQQVEDYRKMFLAMGKDIRVIIIKLADRLHNMRTLSFKSEFKQKENSMETMEIFVPLAYYIGAYRIKSELEDLSLKYLYPDKYKRIEDIKLRVEDDSKHCLSEMLTTINSILINQNISHDIKVRTKNVYGIYKRLEQGHKISNIHDLLSLKIMVDSIAKCYLTLGFIHSKYHPINDKFKDYIYNPKTNMYQSLHTTVFGEDDRLVQTQIRTFDMDKVASFGLTAYWDIQKGNARDVMQEDLKQKYQFFKSLVEINRVFGDNQEFVHQVKSELFSDKIYVYTTKGDIVELPKGATAIDFAYKIHSDLGNTMVSAVVNDKVVDPEHELKTKDRVRIITDVLSYGPREEWLDKVQTTKAKRKIKEFRKEN